MSSRTLQKDWIDLFVRDIEVTNFTMDTTVSLGGPIDAYTIQFDTLASSTDTSFSVDNGGTIIKRGAYASGAGTREVLWVGRRFHFGNYLQIQRPNGDSHTIDVTLIYRPQ